MIFSGILASSFLEGQLSELGDILRPADHKGHEYQREI